MYLIEVILSKEKENSLTSVLQFIYFLQFKPVVFELFERHLFFDANKLAFPLLHKSKTHSPHPWQHKQK